MQQNQIIRLTMLKIFERYNLTYETKPIQIIDRSVKHLRGNEIPLVKVVWKGLSHEEATWEMEDKIKNRI